MDIAKRVTALLLAVGITILLFLMVDRQTIMRFQQWGYAGIFLISLIGNATIALPISAASFLRLWGAALLIGSLSGWCPALARRGRIDRYRPGRYGGSAIIENRRMYDCMHHWMGKYGGLTIFVLSLVPNPIIDLAGIAAGASRFGYFKFLGYCWAGKTIKTLIFAFAGRTR